jgi:hypothetical protein
MTLMRLQAISPGSASDAALMAFDRESVRTLDGEGRLHVAMTNISKATVNPYRGNEIPNHEELGLEPDRVYHLLRDPAELEKAAPTFNGIQVLQKHVPVTAEDHQPWDVVGSTGTDAVFEPPYLKNSLSIWAASAIDSINRDERRELSCGYRYRAEMTPGIFDGMRYDGVMRDIRGNHVALVKDGRAGPDVVVGDSMENLVMKPTRFAASALFLTSAAIAPLLAMDAKLDVGAFKGLTPKNFSEKKPGLVESIRKAVDGKLAQDASLDGVIELLDAIEGTAKGGDEAATDPQVEQMEKIAAVEPPKPAGAGDAAANLGEFLKSKGMGDADIKTACDMMPKAAAADEDPEEKKREEAEKKAEADKAAKDAQMKDMVTKPAMDAAIAAAVEGATKSVRETERGIRAALADVKPWVGELPGAMAFDSAADVHRHAATMLGVPDAKTLHADALLPIIKAQPKPGARPVDVGGQRLAMDSAGAKDFSERFPGASRIGAA